MTTQHQQHEGNNSFSNWQSNKRCDFCMYHELIFDQLERLKQAVIMKNERIQELEDFISKMSEMAFMKNPTVVSLGPVDNMLMPKSTEMIEQQSSSLFLHSPNDSKNFMFKKKTEEQSQISFQDMRLNTAKFEGKNKQSTDFMSRFEKIKELNQIKKELDKQISETADKENNTLSEKMQSYNSSRQFDTIRTLSEPQQQGRVGCIGHESSRLSEFQQKKTMFQAMNNCMSSERNKLTNPPLKKSSSFEDKSSLNIIKNTIKKLQ